MKTVVYWLATILVAIPMLGSGVLDFIHAPMLVESMHDLLGYPLYVMTIIGFWKFLGGLAILAPRMPLVKEWAYAGIFFDLTGAIASHAFSGDAPGVVPPSVILVCLITSWALRPEGRKLAPAES